MLAAAIASSGLREADASRVLSQLVAKRMGGGIHRIRDDVVVAQLQLELRRIGALPATVRPTENSGQSVEATW
jgi:hypothetical protein